VELKEERRQNENIKMPAVNLNSVRNILLALQENWFQSGDQQAIQCAHLLKSALSEENTEVPHLARCSPPSGLCLEGQDKDDQALFQTMYFCWHGLGWTIADHFKLAPELDHKIKEARLVGPQNAPIKSDKIDVKISYVSPNTLVPRHSEEAAEMLQILEGDGIQIGLAVDDWLQEKKYNFFPPTHPKVVKTAEKHFVAISVHYGKLDGKLWLNDDESGTHTVQYIGDKCGGNTECVEKYFDQVCKDYEGAMRFWGYCMPELVSSALIQHGNLKPSKDVKIIDLGCGTGEIGQALHKKGFTTLSGADISEGMIEIAEQKGVYTTIKKANLLQQLPFEEGSFDCAISSAVTTYLDPSALNQWVPIIKKGGLLCVVHKASVWPKWVKEQEKLEENGTWKQVYCTKDPLPFLPSLAGEGTNKARIYIYQKL